ncbi:MAG: hypothetical protein R3E82_11515 [Pseudomonadales bacterium]
MFQGQMPGFIIKKGWRLDRNSLPERYIRLFAATGDREKAKSIFLDKRFDLTENLSLALDCLALGEIDNTFKSIRAGIENRKQYLLGSLLPARWWDPIRDDPRFDEMPEMMGLEVIQTEEHLCDRNIIQQGE